jgi:hypothetical protein
MSEIQIVRNWSRSWGALLRGSGAAGDRRVAAAGEVVSTYAVRG